MKKHIFMSKLIIILALVALTDNLSAGSWYSNWMPNKETFTNWIPSQPQWTNQLTQNLASQWANLSTNQQRAALGALALGLGGLGYGGYNRYQQYRQQQRLDEARRIFEESAAKSSAQKNAILENLDIFEQFISGYERGDPTIDEIRGLQNSLSNFARTIPGLYLELNSTDKQEVYDAIFRLNERLNILLQNSLRFEKNLAEQRRGIDMLLEKIEEEQQQDAEAQQLLQQELEVISDQKIAEYNKRFQSIQEQQASDYERASTHQLHSSYVKLKDEIERDRSLSEEIKQDFRQKIDQQMNALNPTKEGVPVASSLASSSSSSQQYVSQEPYQGQIERSIPLITVQNFSGDSLQIGAKFQNQTVTKPIIINDKGFLTFTTHLNVSEVQKNMAQPISQEGNSATLTREPVFITYKSSAQPWFGTYPIYGINVSNYLNNRDIIAIVIHISRNKLITTLRFKDNSIQEIEESPLTNF